MKNNALEMGKLFIALIFIIVPSFSTKNADTFRITYVLTQILPHMQTINNFAKLMKQQI